MTPQPRICALRRSRFAKTLPGVELAAGRVARQVSILTRRGPLIKPVKEGTAAMVTYGLPAVEFLCNNATVFMITREIGQLSEVWHEYCLGHRMPHQPTCRDQ